MWSNDRFSSMTTTIVSTAASGWPGARSGGGVQRLGSNPQRPAPATAESPRPAFSACRRVNRVLLLRKDELRAARKLDSSSRSRGAQPRVSRDENGRDEQRRGGERVHGEDQRAARRDGQRPRQPGKRL